MGKASRLKKKRQLRLGLLTPQLLAQVEKGELRLLQGDPAGQKISASLIELIQPYLEGNEPIKVYRSAVGIAAMAWNLADLKPGQVEIELARLSAEIGKEQADLMDSCLRDMMARKRRLFPHDHRVVAQWEVEDQGHQFYVRAAALS